ncbi:MAG: hypothetical protein D6737_15720 [Chloroflexi bacterium]|nr:MAG: hypothetical protein CUN54_01070 [Phototrophicales bacterium]RMF78132.1 MAG: hypothetical protein D6737_15720 [Chloroflexota bacterium]
MLFDWLLREGDIVLSWWALVTLAGIAVFPLTLRLLSGLPDRGYTMARAAGLLVVGFTYWALASLGFLRNTPGNIALAWLIVLTGSLVLYFRAEDRIDMREWWGENRRVVIAGEVLFIVLLFAWALVRSFQNSLTGTEKPMELAFLSAVQRSETFPPNDPWMSGYAISYYYFGYVMSSMLSMMSNIVSTIGFNMTISLLFALTGLTSFGVAYNLVRSRAFRVPGELLEKASSQRTAIGVGVLGMVFVILLGNFQLPLIELPYQTRTAPESYLEFWQINERTTYPERQQARAEGIPDTEPIVTHPVNLLSVDDAGAAFWWWFRASRVLTDRNLDGTEIGVQPIDEFPQFSFLLADNHPHVLALPFAMLALGLALNVLLVGRAPNGGEIVFYGLCLGGLAFLNAWDGPIYTVVLLAVEGVRRLIRNGTGRLRIDDVWAIGRLALTLLFLTLLFYLPWLVSFRSQASGVLPNLLHPTLFRQFFIMFGPFILLLGAYLAVETWRGRLTGRLNLRLGLLVALSVLLVLVGAMLFLTLLGSLVPELRGIVLRFVDQNGGWGVVLPQLLERRVTYSITTLVLLSGIALVVARLFPRHLSIVGLADVDDEQRRVVSYPPATGFALAVAAVAMLLTLFPEFLFLRDNFAVRINTVFKFYYQAWLMFSVASAYAVYSIMRDNHLQLPSPSVRLVFAGGTALIVTAGLLYPVLGVYNRIFLESGFLASDNPRALTLDGGPTLVQSDDFLSITCFRDFVTDDDVVVAEAIGPAYRSQFGRVAGLSGVPIVLGWENHERQWRGSTYNEVAGSRAQDIALLYADVPWERAQEVIDRYGIDYIFYGSSERSSYGPAGEIKFQERLEPVCQQGGSVFYRVGVQHVAQAR